MGAVDAITVITRGGSEPTAVWGEFDANDSMMSEGTVDSVTGSSAEYLGSIIIDRGNSGTVARDVDCKHIIPMFREAEYFFVSGCIPDDSLLAVVCRHNPPPILGDDDTVDTVACLHGWTLLPHAFDPPSTNMTIAISCYDLTFVRKGDCTYITLRYDLDLFRSHGKSTDAV